MEEELGLLRAATGTPIDLAPAWSPDGTELVFGRSLWLADGTGSTALHRISATGGEPQEVAAVAEEPMAVFAGVRWLSDDRVLYCVALRDANAANGLWSVAAEGGEPGRIVDAADAGLEAPVLVGVSTSGRALLLDAASVESVFVLVELATGRTEPVAPPAGSDETVAAATFSPDGSRLLFSAHNRATGQRLVLLDLATGRIDEVGAISWLVGAIQFRSGLTWAANDLVFGTGGAQTGLLVRLAFG